MKNQKRTKKQRNIKNQNKNKIKKEEEKCRK
jgi:hypothetical protein